MHMGMMPLVVESGVPAQVLTADLHVLGEHRTLGAQQRHPLLRTVIAKPCGILPPQGHYMSPDRAFVRHDFFLYLCQYNGFSRIGKQTMLTHPFHTGTVCDVIYIVFPFGYEVEVLLQRTGDKFRGIADGRL